MANPGECDAQTDEEKKKNEDAAQRPYGGVNVLVSASDAVNNTITFFAADPVGAPVAHTERWGDTAVMWAPCPSSLPSKAQVDNPGLPPPPGTAGLLYLSEQYMKVHPDLRSTTPKYPKRLAQAGGALGFRDLEVWPTSIQITGVRMIEGKMSIDTIDLLDGWLLEPGQAITADGSILTLKTTGKGLPALEKQGRSYNGVNVLVTATDPAADTITFFTAGSTGAPVKLTVPWGDDAVTWAADPSTLPLQAQPGNPRPPPAPGASGLLYLSQNFLAAHAGELRAPKWPPLSIWPTGIKITGIELAPNGVFGSGTVDLLDGQLAEPGQTIINDGSKLTLRLTADGRGKFGVVTAPI